MLSRGVCIKIVVLSLLAVMTQHVARLVLSTGIFSHYYPHYPGPCKKLDGIQPGSENFHTLPNGLTFITSGFRLQKMGQGVERHFHDKQIKGRIYLYDFKNIDLGLRELKISSTNNFSCDTFYPHGISVWEDKVSGRHTVFVVNHAMDEPGVDRIERFVYNPDTLELHHKDFYSGEEMKVVNDVQATGENSFYFTNYQYFRVPALAMLEAVLELTWTDAIYFDGKSYTIVADKMRGANGIAMSNDQHISGVLAVSSSAFYITNTFTQRTPTLLLLEMAALMPWSNVMYCDDFICYEVAGGMLGARGIAMGESDQRQFIYVAPCLGSEIRVFRRNKDNSLTPQQVYPLYTVPDNILVDPKTGDLYVGCHPLVYQIMKHLEDPDQLSPSQGEFLKGMSFYYHIVVLSPDQSIFQTFDTMVLHLRVKDGNITSAQELLYDDGTLISASTAAMVYDGKMLVGSVFHNLILCDVNVPL